MKKALLISLVIALLGFSSSFAYEDSPQTRSMPQQADSVTWEVTECEEDLTGETITFYHFGDLSGTFAFISQPLVAGFTDGAEFLNETGGVCGATVVQEFRDTGGSQDQAQAFWDELSVRDDAYSIFLYASADGELLREQALEQETVIFIAAGSELALYGEDGTPGNMYAIIPLYADQLGGFCDYIAENWASFGIEGDPVMGHVSWLGAFGQSTNTEAARAYCEAARVGYAGAEYYLPISPNVSTQVQAVVDNGANILFTTSLASGPAQIAGTVETEGLGDEVLVSGVNWVLDTSVIGLGGAATNGMVGLLPYTWWDEFEHPGVQVIAEKWRVNRLETAATPTDALAVRNIAYLVSFASLDMWREAMVRTINAVGWENLSGAALDATMQEFSYEPMGGIFRVDYTEGNRSVSSARIGSIQFIELDGNITPTIQPLTDWFDLPDLRTVGGADVP
ncbi:MAG: ABC transporter substrate-binding protein [Anaerolineae bacterium]|nr:ABC transporter substrate-binding protein [Anaerolineae bacterium]